MTVDIGTMRKNQRLEPSTEPPLVRAKVIAPAPIATSTTVRVQAVNDPSAGLQYLGDAPWVAQPDASIPAIGDECLVAFDDTGQPWVVGWVRQTGVGRGTELPTSPVDGQEYDYIADAAKGVVWRFCYRTASSSSYKWEFVGGSALGFAPVNEALGFTAAIGEKEFATKLTVPLAGEYNYIGGVSFFGAEGEAGLNEGEALLGKNGALVSLTFGRTVWNNAWEGAPLVGSNSVTVAAGDKLGIRVANRQPHISHVFYPQLLVTPVRVG